MNSPVHEYVRRLAICVVIAVVMAWAVSLELAAVATYATGTIIANDLNNDLHKVDLSRLQTFFVVSPLYGLATALLIGGVLGEWWIAVLTLVAYVALGIFGAVYWRKDLTRAHHQLAQRPATRPAS